VPVIADRGIVTGGDICKCIACGGRAVIRFTESPGPAKPPGRGLSTGHGHAQAPVVPAHQRIKVAPPESWKTILRGTAKPL